MYVSTLTYTILAIGNFFNLFGYPVTYTGLQTFLQCLTGVFSVYMPISTLLIKEFESFSAWSLIFLVSLFLYLVNIIINGIKSGFWAFIMAFLLSIIHECIQRISCNDLLKHCSWCVHNHLCKYPLVDISMSWFHLISMACSIVITSMLIDFFERL